ncbi:hypothetical protein J2Z83_002483 [Virgibacillus natechei]|uniref:Anti-sigma factor n=1 Tax=Virgibacillus natechei TaxID=1216297 RepID=A0ABS4IHH0_9BACI|nr:anti-sigma factor [Virgibacillus natechei]MBP1970365.1 hypothetical protein [Virgibacillus natechei]UZD13190.1 anti-sigma factor [Virgibacillus natechei]
MNNEEFKKKLDDYNNGLLSEKDEKQVEAELEKVEIYQDYIDYSLDEKHVNSKKKESDTSNQMKVLNQSKRKAIITNTLVTASFILMILPITTAFTFLYYGYGIDQSKGNQFLKVITDTITITEPNTRVELDSINENISPFSMSTTMDLYKRIGKREKQIGEQEHSLWMSSMEFPERNYLIDAPDSVYQVEDSSFLVPPAGEISSTNEFRLLDELPDGTVGELYVSLGDLYNEADVKSIFSELDVDLTWFAVNTGIDQLGVNDQGLPIQPIGYPAETNMDINSSFNKNANNQEQFLDVLRNLAKHEEWATTAARSKALNLTDRINFLEEGEIQIYGVVLTGPTNELLKVENLSQVSKAEVGEVELWNWVN